MPEDLGDLYVAVNIPEFTLRIVKNGAVIHTERVISGQPGKQTPVFSEYMKMIVFQPRWTCPPRSRCWSCGPALRAAVPRSGVRGCACRAMAATSIPRVSTGARRTSATTTSTSRRARAMCWAN